MACFTCPNVAVEKNFKASNNQFFSFVADFIFVKVIVATDTL
jgi:hypothetical protein